MSQEISKGKFEWVYTIIAIVVGVSVLIALVGKNIVIGKDAPPYMDVYVDQVNSTYYAPPYILGNKYPSTLDVKNLKRETISEAKSHNYKPDSTCVDMGYFKEKYTLTDSILIKLGLVHPSPSRWNPDGSWNW